ncbi:MAG: lipid A biosynthesis acyltransferase [Chitinophagaceae bacterium]
MYYIVYGLFYLISLLPLRVLYFLSDAFYGLTYYILKYRRDVVSANLKIAFPEKTDAERKKIEKQFYHNFIDSFVETIKLVSSSERFIEKHFTANWDVINKVYESGRRAHLHLGHNFNWEWGNVVLGKKTPFKFLAVYTPISNQVFERLFLKMRSRSGVTMLPSNKMKEAFLPYRNTQYLLGLVADQNPSNPSRAWWFNFFGKPAPFVKGPAKNAITSDAVIILASIKKPRRGYYEGIFSLHEEHPEQHTEQELTKKFIDYLENNIRENPSLWLWSHRRWRWDWKPEYGEIIS